MLEFEIVAILILIPIVLCVGYVLGHAAGHRQHTKYDENRDEGLN